MLLKNRMLGREGFRFSKETKTCENNRIVVRASLSIRLETSSLLLLLLGTQMKRQIGMREGGDVMTSASVNGNWSSYLS